MKKLYGVTAAMVTPFDSQGKVNLEAVGELTDFLIGRGIHCLYPLGTTGEMPRLTAQERMTVADAVVHRANGRVPVYIHCGLIVLFVKCCGCNNVNV